MSGTLPMRAFGINTRHPDIGIVLFAGSTRAGADVAGLKASEIPG
jgi:acyl-CoA reductase-like NAD-dependent aldehyde dehydrogenase